MKVKNLTLMALLAGGMFFASANAALAEDKPLPIVDCADGYVAVSSSDGYTVTCEPVDETGGLVEIDPTSGCWTTEDGTDVCARGFVGSTDPQPIDPGCKTTVDADGNEIIACPEVIAYSGLPVDDDSTMGTGDVKSTSGMERDLVLTGAGNTQDGTLPFLGMFFGLLGAAVIALMHKPITK